MIDQKKVLEQRIIDQYANNFLYGMHYLKKQKEKKLLLKFLKLKLKLNVKYFRKVYIPQVEYAITTRCTLKCEACTNYIPTIENENQHTTDINEYKTTLNNLLKGVDKICSFCLLGGEPLLNKDFNKILEYTLKQRKIHEVFVTTNGTIDFNEELIRICKKYSKKVNIWISNYTENKNLASKLKTKNIIDKLKTDNIKVIFQENLRWHKVNPIKYQNRTREENINYYINKCFNPCVSIMNKELSSCPRASVMSVRGIIKQVYPEAILLDKVVTKQKIREFYNNFYYSACNFCSIDTETKTIAPAIQIGEQE